MVGVNGARLDGLSFAAAVELIKAAGQQGGPRVFTVRRCPKTVAFAGSLEEGTGATAAEAGSASVALAATSANAAAAATVTTAAVAPYAAADEDNAGEEAVESTAASGDSDGAREDDVALHNSTVKNNAVFAGVSTIGFVGEVSERCMPL